MSFATIRAPTCVKRWPLSEVRERALGAAEATCGGGKQRMAGWNLPAAKRPVEVGALAKGPRAHPTRGVRRSYIRSYTLCQSVKAFVAALEISCRRVLQMHPRIFTRQMARG